MRSMWTSRAAEHVTAAKRPAPPSGSAEEKAALLQKTNGGAVPEKNGRLKRQQPIGKHSKNSKLRQVSPKAMQQVCRCIAFFAQRKVNENLRRHETLAVAKASGRHDFRAGQTHEWLYSSAPLPAWSRGAEPQPHSCVCPDFRKCCFGAFFCCCGAERHKRICYYHKRPCIRRLFLNTC